MPGGATRALDAAGRALDCAIIGAGPGGLTAAIYLARFRRSTLILDAGNSRAKWIPESHNCPGFPSGIGGTDFLARMSDQAASWGGRVEADEVTGAHREGDRFVLEARRGPIIATNVILATGCEDALPQLPGLEDAVRCGVIRFCPVCDAYEAIDQRIAVYGPFAAAASHALFMRTYSRSVTVVPTDAATDEQAWANLREAEVAVAGIPVDLSFDGTRCAFSIDGRQHDFDVVYPMLGSRPRSELAVSLGARIDDEGALVVTRHQMTSVPGLYAIGDVVSALNQISVATGHAAVAATAVHNALPRQLA